MEQPILIFLGALLAGLFGSLSGLGGGVVIVPMLLFLGVDIYHAIAASLIAVIATSSMVSTAYARRGYANIKICLFLATATSLGAVIGAVVGLSIPKSALFILLGCLLVYSVIAAYLPHQKESLTLGSPLADRLRLNDCGYVVKSVVPAYGVMIIAGMLSGMLGIGSGAVKVLAMDRLMGLPFRVSTATSNMMIGITAVASAGVYLGMGYVEPVLVGPLVFGASIGSFVGSQLFPRIHVELLRHLFHALVLAIAAQMFYDGMVWHG